MSWLDKFDQRTRLGARVFKASEPRDDRLSSMFRNNSTTTLATATPRSLPITTRGSSLTRNNSAPTGAGGPGSTERSVRAGRVSLMDAMNPPPTRPPYNLTPPAPPAAYQRNPAQPNFWGGRARPILADDYLDDFNSHECLGVQDCATCWMHLGAEDDVRTAPAVEENAESGPVEDGPAPQRFSGLSREELARQAREGADRDAQAMGEAQAAPRREVRSRGRGRGRARGRGRGTARGRGRGAAVRMEERTSPTYEGASWDTSEDPPSRTSDPSPSNSGLPPPHDPFGPDGLLPPIPPAGPPPGWTPDPAPRASTSRAQPNPRVEDYESSEEPGFPSAQPGAEYPDFITGESSLPSGVVMDGEGDYLPDEDREAPSSPPPIPIEELRTRLAASLSRIEGYERDAPPDDAPSESDWGSDRLREEEELFEALGRADEDQRLWHEQSLFGPLDDEETARRESEMGWEEEMARSGAAGPASAVGGLDASEPSPLASQSASPRHRSALGPEGVPPHVLYRAQSAWIEHVENYHPDDELVALADQGDTEAEDELEMVREDVVSEADVIAVQLLLDAGVDISNPEVRDWVEGLNTAEV